MDQEHFSVVQAEDGLSGLEPDLEGKAGVDHLSGSADALEVEEEPLEKCDRQWLEPEGDIELPGKLGHQGHAGADHGSFDVVLS